MTLRSAGLMALLVLGTSASGQVNTTAPVAADSGVATVDQESFSGGVSLNGTYFDVRHQTNSGVGYRNGFTQFGAFSPIWGSEDWFVAPNLRMTLTDDMATGFNAGVVARRYSAERDRILGVNAYYDNDQSSNNNRYHQFGFGVESLGRIIDVRANGYVPSSSDANFVSPTGLSPTLVFFENRLGFIGTQLVEQALAGGDGEIGAPLAPDMPWLRGYIGAYAYKQHDDSTPVGFRGRVEGWVTNDLSLGAMVTSDTVFGTNVNFIVDWRFAGFQPTRYFPNWSTRDRMLMPVQRQWRISTAESEEQVNILADNPRDGNPYFVVWVDPDALAVDPGTGTFEDPFHAMPPAVPGETDLVLVLRGDTTAATPISGPITLPDFARMLGQGHAHILDATATFGPFTQTVDDALMPDLRFRNTGLYPFLTNPGGNIVNVGNHNEVAAFVMENATGAAIASAATSGFHFHHLEITGNNGGIVLTNAQGAGGVTTDGQSILSGQITDINRNAVVGWANAAGLGDNGTPGGINIATDVANLDLILARISMNSTSGAQDFGIRLLADQGRLNVDMRDISTSNGNAVAGVSIEQLTGEINANIVNLATSLNDGIGLRLLSGNLRPMNVTGTSVAAIGNTGDNMQIAGAGNATFNAVFSASTFDNSVTGSGISLNMSSGIKSLSLTDVTASTNALSGLDLASSGGTLNFTADNLTANGNGLDNLQIGTQLAPLTSMTFVGNITDSFFNGSLAGSGIVFSQSNGSTGTLDLLRVQTNNNVNGPGLGGDGMGLFGANGAVMNIHNTNGQSNFNSRDGFHVEEVGGANVTLVVDPTSATNNGRDGLFFNLAGNSLLTVTFQDDTLTDNVRSAVNGTVNNSQVDLLFDNTSGDRSGANGFFLIAVNNSVANLTLTNGTSFVDSDQSAPGSFSGVDVRAFGGSTLNLTMNGTAVGNTLPGGTADFGLSVVAGSGANVVVNATGASFDNVSTNAIRASVGGIGTTATLNLTDTTGANSGGSGLLALVGNNGLLTLELDNADFLDAGGHGLNAFVSGGGLLNACILDSNFDRAGGAGVRITTTGAGSESNIHMENSSANGNLLGGLEARALAGGDLNLRTVGTSFDGNGTFGALDFDGVFVRADGLGSAARLLFNTTSADNNSRHGFNFEAANGAYMTARLDSVSAQNNGGYGVRLDATGAGTNAVLIPEGTNTISGNGLGSFSINYSGTDFAIVPLMGSFNGQPGDGVNVTINGVGAALVTLTGSGTDTISGNGGDGVDIRISNADSAGIRIAGYSDISNNVEDGIHIELTNIGTSAAVEVLGPTAMTDNGDDGVDILLTNVALGVFAPPPGVDPLSVITLTDNDSLNDCVPEPVDVPFNSVVTSPAADGILLDQLTITRTGGAPAAGQDGISIGGTNVTGTGTITMTNNTITNYDTGINASFAAGSSFGGVIIDSAIIDQSAASGIALNYNASGSPISITNSAITNSGATGLDVVLLGAIGGFDITFADTTVSDSAGGGVSIAGTGALGDVTLTNVSATNSTAGDGVGVVLGGGSANSITLTNVSAATSSGNGILVDLTGLAGLTSVTVDGQSTASVTDSGANGILVNLTNLSSIPNVSVGSYTNVLNSAGHGIAVIATGTDLGAVDLSNNTVNNSTAGDGIRFEMIGGNNIPGPITLDSNIVNASSGNGINLLLDGVSGGADLSTTNSNIDGSGAIGINLSAVGATLGTVLLDPSTVTDSQDDGVRMDFTNAGVARVTVDQFTIINSGVDGSGNGLTILLTGATVANDVTVTETTVTDSANSGVSITGTGATIGGDVVLTDVSVTNSVLGDGVAVLLDGGSVNAVLLTNVSSDTSGGRGIHVDLNAVAGITAVTVDGDGTAVASNSGSDGILVNLTNITSVPAVNVGNYSLIDNNGHHGLAVIATGTDLDTIDLSDNTVSRSNTGDGIRLEIANNSVIGPVTMANNTVSDSSNHGINMILHGVTGGADVTVSNSTVSDTGSFGIRLAANGADLGAIVFDTATVTNSGGQGTEINLVGSIIESLLVDQFTIDTSGGRGLNVILDNVIGVPPNPTITISNTTATTSGGRGISVAGNAAFLGDVTLTDVSSDTTTAGEGVAVVLSNGTVGAIDLTNVSANASASTGILVDLNTETVGSPIALNGGGASFSTNNGGDGIRVTLNTVAGTPDVSVTNYQLVDNNAGNGIIVLNNGSAVGDVTVSDNIVGNSTAGDGIQVSLNGTVGVVELDGNTVSDSSNNGINVNLDTVTGSDVTISNSTVTNSAGGDGVRLFARNSTLNDLLIDTVSVTNSNIDGIAVIDDPLGTGSSINSVVLNQVNSDTTNLGDGVSIQLTNTTSLTNVAVIGGGTITNSAFDGIGIVLDGVTGTPDVTVDGYNVSASGNGGILINTNPTPIAISGSPVGAVTVSNNTVDTSNGDRGITIDLTNSLVASVLVDTNTISNSFGRGLDVVLDGVNNGANPNPTIDVLDTTVTNSGIGGVTGRGVSVAGNGFPFNPMALGTITLTNVSSDTTGAEEGVAVDLIATAPANGKVGDITLTNVTALNSFGTGILTSLTNMTIDPSITIDGQGTAQSSNNGTGGAGDGILVTLNNVVGVPTPLDVTIDNYLFIDNNAGRGIALESNGVALGAVSISNNVVTNSTLGQGIQIDIANSVLGSLLVDTNTISDSFDRGLDVILSGVNGGANPPPVITVSNTTATNSGGRGVSVAGSGATTVLGDILLTNVSSTTTTADEGVAVVFDTGATIDSILLNNVSADQSATTGILVSLDTVTVGPAITVDGQGAAQSTNNGGDGILVSLNALTGVPNLSVSNYAQIGTNTGAGVLITQTNAANVGTVDIAGNIINGNGTNGVELQVTASTQGLVTFTENQITGHTAGDGVNIVQLGDTDNLIDLEFFRNTISGNSGGRGVNLDMQYAVAGITLNADFTNDTIANNGQEGISILMTSDVVATVTINSDAGTANPNSGNFNSELSGNGSFGLLISTDDTASFDLTVGGAGGQNLISGNQNAGIGLLMNNGPVAQGAVFSTFDISNVAISNNVAGANVNFTGEGLGVVLNDGSVLRNATLGDAALVNTTLADNASDGFGLTMVQSTIVSDLTVRNSTFVDTTNAQDNGININRRNDSKLTGTVISSSTFTGHTADGINLDVQGGDTDIELGGTYEIDVLIGGPLLADGNTFTNNQRGVDILVTADAQLDVGIGFNTFDSNTSDGIRAQTDFFADIVTGAVHNSVWHDNTFTNNAGDAINLIATRASSMTIAINDTVVNNTPGTGLDGIQITNTVDANVTLNVSDTSITGVGRDGIQVDTTTSLGNGVTLNLTNVSITSPGQDGIDLTNAAGGFLDLTSVGTTAIGPGTAVGTGNGLIATSSSFGVVTITSTNDIFREFGADGISLNATGSNAIVANNIDATFNDMQSRFNGGRGVELFNRGDANMSVTIQGTGANDPRPSDGAVATSRIEENGLNGLFVENNAEALNTDNTLTLNLHQTSVRGNGIAAVTPSDDDRNGVWIRAGTSTSGRINATVTSNVMSGNQNIDFVTQSFTATPSVAVNSQYTSGTHVIDPVARLGLILGGAGLGNEGDQIDLVRNNSGANPAATYSNADSFKSPGAIFGANTRPRNAQRYATGVFGVAADTVQAAPAPTTTTFTGTGAGEGFGGQGTLVNLGVTINGQTRDVGYTPATNLFTVAALAAAPVATDPFVVFGDRISGYGAESSFRSQFASVAAGGNTFTTVLSNFGTNLAVAGGRGPFSVFNETYTWTTDVTPFTSP